MVVSYRDLIIVWSIFKQSANFGFCNVSFLSHFNKINEVPNWCSIFFQNASFVIRMMTMGVTSFILVFSLLLFEVTFVHTLDEGEETTTTQKIREEKREPPTIEIGVTVVSNRHSLETNNSQENSEFWILVDTWWKILAWSSAVLLLSGLCCYFSKCCYLCWDCCSDPFWGCFPRSEGCLRCLSMRGT